MLDGESSLVLGKLTVAPPVIDGASFDGRHGNGRSLRVGAERGVPPFVETSTVDPNEPDV